MPVATTAAIAPHDAAASPNRLAIGEHEVAGRRVTPPPFGMGSFEFAVIASLRVKQLQEGCLPRVRDDDRTIAVIARCEVSQGRVTRLPARPVASRQVA